MDLFFREERDWSTGQVARLVRSHKIFSMLTQLEAVQLVQYMRPKRVKSGSVLFQEGEKHTGFMALILKGQARVESGASAHGEPLMLTVLGEGDLIGEQGILDNAARSATVIAATDMALATISESEFLRLTREAPSLGCKILLSVLRTATSRLTSANKRLLALHAINRTMAEFNEEEAKRA